MYEEEGVARMGERIGMLRKQHGMTQEALAGQLGVSYQAVSKWETGNACPDIALLPLLARIFDVPMEVLFGLRGTAQEQPKKSTAKRESGPDILTDIRDDGALRVLIFRGHTLLDHREAREQHIHFTYEGEALNVYAQCDLACAEVQGNATANGKLSIEGDVQGNATANGGIECGDIGGDAHSNGGISCDGIEGDANANGGIECGDIGGDASANGSLTCGDVGGDASSKSNIECGDIGGDAHCEKGNITCGSAHGDVTAGGSVECNDIQGSVTAGGNVTCDHIEVKNGHVHVGKNLEVDSIQAGGDVYAEGTVTVHGAMYCGALRHGRAPFAEEES